MLSHHRHDLIGICRLSLDKSVKSSAKLRIVHEGWLLLCRLLVVKRGVHQVVKRLWLRRDGSRQASGWFLSLRRQLCIKLRQLALTKQQVLVLGALFAQDDGP